MKNGRCKICQHVDRSRVEYELAGGASLKSISKKYAAPYHAVYRHWQNHVDPERKANLVLGPVQRQALAARVAEENTSVIDQYRIVRSGLYQLYDAAITAADGSIGAMLAGRLHENLSNVARLTGQLATSPLILNQTNNFFFNDPRFADFQARLIRILSRFPDACSAVIAEFESLEPSPAAMPALEHRPNA
jgi:hypothetical protein